MKRSKIEQRIKKSINIESRDFLDKLLQYKPEPINEKDLEFLMEINKDSKSKINLFSKKHTKKLSQKTKRNVI